MDTVISNKYAEVLDNLNIEVSKKIEGEFDVDEIISTFGNYFFNKMFLDITAIKDYKNIKNLQKLSMNINMDKVILLLDESDTISNSKTFLSKLVSMGIYNFTKDKEGLMYLYDNPNTYRDVAQYQEVEENDPSKENRISQINTGVKILGIKSLTDNAGSTTLTYMLKKTLEDYYSVVAIELNKRDFIYYNDKELLSIKENDLERTIDNHSATDVFIVDLNKASKEYLCTDVLYLIEPSILKINKLTLIDKNIAQTLKTKKVILNKNLLSKSEIADFEVNTNIKVYHSIPPLNDNKDNSDTLLPLMEKIGYVKVAKKDDKENKKISLFNLFK